MTREDIDNIIKVICPNDEDFEKPCISPAYLKKELEALALEQEPKTEQFEKLIDAIDFAIKATGSQDDYCMGMSNGMRYVKSLIDGKEPQYELRWNLGDEVVSKWGTKGVVVGIDTSCEGDVFLSLLMKDHKVPQFVEASNYTKTGRHFPQIIEVLEQIKGEADGK